MRLVRADGQVADLPIATRRQWQVWARSIVAPLLAQIREYVDANAPFFSVETVSTLDIHKRPVSALELARPKRLLERLARPSSIAIPAPPTPLVSKL